MSLLRKFHTWLGSLLDEKTTACDHCYWPEYGVGNKPIGQTCSLCGQFNSLEDLGLSYDLSKLPVLPLSIRK